MTAQIRCLAFVAAVCAAAPLSAKECKFRELADKRGEVATITAKIKEIEPDGDNPKQLYITVDNTGTEHCFSYITGVPKGLLGGCAVGKTVTATGKVQEGMDAWWGLEKVKEFTCK